MFRSLLTTIRVLVVNRVQQLNNMCILQRYNYLQLCYPDPNHRVVREKLS